MDFDIVAKTTGFVDNQLGFVACIALDFAKDFRTVCSAIDFHVRTTTTIL